MTDANSRERGDAQKSDATSQPQVASATDIPKSGWKQIAMKSYASIGDDRVLAVAAGVTFYGILAVFPMIGALISIYGLFADPATVNDHLAQLSGFLPGGAVDIIGEQVKHIAEAGRSSLSLSFIFGLVLALWGANAGIKAMFDALNVAYGDKERRGFVALNLTSLTFTAGAVIFMLLAIGAVVVLPVALNFVGLGNATETILRLGRWPALWILVALGLALLYRFGPSRAEPKWRWITWGSVTAALLWLVVSGAFSWYAANFGSYNKTYGSLGAAIGFMTWIWISAIVIIMGGELNSEIEQAAAETAQGKE